MKKCFFLLMTAALSLLVSVPAFAIEDPNPKGTFVVGLQIGPRTGACLDFYVDIDDYLNIDYGTNGGFMLGIEPMLTADYVLVDSWWKGHFTVGAMLGAYRIGTLGSGERRHHSAVTIIPRAMYGLNLSSRWEVHAGFGLGAAFRSCSAHVEGDSGPAFTFCSVTGARFNISDSFSITADLNLSGFTPLVGVGVSFKF
ncbi:MAG: hypothetical protein IJ799_08385 [Bacteroidales bacterium]|nr:hypothetical protein [Bacteroidales bacterium]MBR1870061.1 hypothetical protein [Bacteroidales bacterium]